MSKRQQRITIEDVAREAGVSMMTVSRVINNKGRISDTTRQHVREVADRLGYRPNRTARALVTNRTMLVGFVVPDITNPYFSEIFQGVEEFFWQEGYNVLVANTNETREREQTVLSQLDEGTIDGLIICSSRLSDDILQPLLKQHHAIVTINRRTPEDVASVVIGHYRQGSLPIIAARHLKERGYQKIGFITLEHSPNFLPLKDFVREVAEEGIVVDLDWCTCCQPTWRSGYETACALLEAHPEIDAIIGGNDQVALGVMQAAKERGISIPDELGIIGVDDILMASLVTPPLTTFQMPKRTIGTEAARLLLLRMQGDTTYREYTYGAELIQRGST